MLRDQHNLSRIRFVGLATFLLLGFGGERSIAANGAPMWRSVPWTATSGSHDGRVDGFRVAWATEVHVQGAACMRILFAHVNLGQSSYVLLHADNGDLRLDAVSMKEYFYGSAILAGDRAQVELHVAPGDRGVSIRVESVLAGNPGPEVASLCSADNRVASNDNRIGRLTRISGMDFLPECTAWRISNGALLTAGHCADFDPDDGGPLLPDGILDINGFVEFNVPTSDADGTMNIANMNDQYPVDVASVRWRYDGQNQGLGKDWTVFRVNRNANTRLMPHEAYGAPFRVTRELPPVNETLRVTGFGIDDGAENQTNQTSIGPFRGEVTSGADIRIDHRVDTTRANSGSPIIWDFMNLTMGIHTNGGCDNTPSSTNSATSFEVDALETAINDFPGTETVYVDHTHPLRIAEEGTLFRPFATLQPAIDATPNNGIVSMYIGFYGLPSGTILNRPMTLQGPAGGVVILGN